jgi:drug/metabolite transporter (DMT)-like permease
VLACFSGMLIILRPGWIEVSSGSLIILFSALCWGMGMVIVKKLTETDGTMSIILWFTLWTTIATFPFAASQWVWPEAEDYFWLFVMGILGSIGHLAAVSGFKIADASSVMPMDFLRLVWISLFGFLFFGEIPEVWTLIGAAVILAGSGLLMIPSKS